MNNHSLRPSRPDSQSRSKKFWSSIRQEDREPVFQDDSPEGQLRAFLWGNRIKATDTRVDILQMLSEEPYPVASSAIIKKLSHTHSERTLYRALDDLLAGRLINNIDFGHGHAYYEIAVGRKHHHHAVCTSCGDIEDVTGCAREALDDMSAGLKKFKHIRSHSLEFFGLCRKCETIS